MVLLLSAAGAISAIPIVAVGLSHFIEIGFKDFSESNNELGNSKTTLTAGKGFLILTAIYFVGISAILRANVKLTFALEQNFLPLCPLP